MLTCYYFMGDGDCYEFSNDRFDEEKITDLFPQLMRYTEGAAYLAVLHRITIDNARKAMRYRIKDEKFFWKANKRILDYAYSVYSIREYLCHFCPERRESKIYRPFRTAYDKSGSWLRFICEFRNYLMHHSAIIKYYEKTSGELILDLDSFVEYEENEYEHRKKPCRKEFLDWLISFRDECDMIDSIHNVRMIYVIQEVDDELISVLNETYSIIFEHYLRRGLDILFSLIYNENGQYYRSYYEMDDDKYYCPNDELEHIFESMINNAGLDSELRVLFERYLKEKNYRYLFRLDKSLDDYLSELKDEHY